MFIYSKYSMLYTFEVTESVLDRIEQYLDRTYVERPDQYILAVQRRITDDLLYVIIDCHPETATYIHLLVWLLSPCYSATDSTIDPSTMKKSSGRSCNDQAAIWAYGKTA
jgi:hypothetical protein